MGKLLAALIALAISTGVITATGALTSPTREATQVAAVADLRSITQEATMRSMLDGTPIEQELAAAITRLDIPEATAAGRTVTWTSVDICYTATLDAEDYAHITECAPTS